MDSWIDRLDWLILYILMMMVSLIEMVGEVEERHMTR
jgi:hypothetical protein